MATPLPQFSHNKSPAQNFRAKFTGCPRPYSVDGIDRNENSNVLQGRFVDRESHLSAHFWVTRDGSCPTLRHRLPAPIRHCGIFSSINWVFVGLYLRDQILLYAPWERSAGVSSAA